MHTRTCIQVCLFQEVLSEAGGACSPGLDACRSLLPAPGFMLSPSALRLSTLSESFLTSGFLLIGLLNPSTLVPCGSLSV